MTNYPDMIDTTISLPTVVDLFTPTSAVTVNRLRDAIIAIESTLGVQPNGIYTTVAGRISVLETTVNNLDSISLGGDLGNTRNNPFVIGIQGRPVSSVAPGLDNVLMWDGIAWVPGSFGAIGAAGGDLSGIYPDPTVVKIQGNSVKAQILGVGQDTYLLTWVNANNRWEAVAPPISFTAGGDLSGTNTDQTVIGIQGNPVKSQTLGAGQDSYIATWVNADGMIEFLPAPVGFSAGGDLTGTATSQTVAKIQGIAISGTPATGYVIQANSSSSAVWQMPAFSPTDVSPGTAGQIFVTNNTPASTWTSLINLELTHGRFTSGGNGSDFKTVIGPRVSNETVQSTIAFLAQATTPTANTWSVGGNGTDTLFGVQSGGTFYFEVPGVSVIATMEGTHGRLTSGGVGSDVAATIGPVAGFETTFGGIIFGNIVNEVGVLSDGTNTYLTALGGWDLEWQSGGNLYGVSGVNMSVGNSFSSGVLNLVANNTTAAILTAASSHALLTIGGNGSDCKAVIGPLTGSEASYAGLHLLANGATPTGSNPVMYSDGTNAYWNSPSGSGQLGFVNGGSAVCIAISWSSGTFTFESLINTVQFAHGITAPIIRQVAASSDVAPQVLTITPQGPYASAVTHVDAGDVLISIPASISGSTHFGGLAVAYNGTRNVLIGDYEDGIGFAAIWLSGNAVSPSNTNWALIGSSSTTQLNAVTELVLNSGGAIFAEITGTTCTIGDLSTIVITPDQGGGAHPSILGQGSYFVDFTIGTNVASGVLHLSTDTNVLVETLSKTLSTQNTVIWSSPALTPAATLSLNDNGAIFFGAGNASINYILFNGSSGNTYVTYSGSEHIFTDNGPVTYGTLTQAGGLVLKGNSTTPYVQSATNSTQLTVGTNKSSAILNLQADAAATIVALASTGLTFTDTGVVTRGTWESTHGRLTAGGGGSDYKAVIGPLVASETAGASVWLLNNAHSPSGSNWSLNNDDTATLALNGPTQVAFYVGGSTPVIYANASVITSYVPIIQFDASVASPTIDQAQSTSGAGAKLSIIAQAAKSGSNDNGGDLLLTSGALDGSGAQGVIHIGDDRGGIETLIGYNAGVGASTTELCGSPVVIQAYGGGGSLEIYATAMYFDWGGGLGGFATFDLNTMSFHNLATAPLIYQFACASDVAPVNLTITAQAPYASASTYKTPGEVVVNIPATIASASFLGGFRVDYAGTPNVRIGTYGAANTYAGIWFLDGGSPSAGNFSFLSDGSSVFFNAPSALGLLYFRAGDTSELLNLNASQSAAYFGGTSSAGPIFVQWSTVTAPTILSGTSATQLTVGTNKSGAVLALQSDTASNSIVAELTEVDLLVSGHTHVALTSGTLTFYDPTAHTSIGSLSWASSGNFIFGPSGSPTSLQLLGSGGANLLKLGVFSEFQTYAQFDNVSTPSTPTSGPVVFGSGGALKAIGTSGTITTMAAADPHCPRCNSDFAVEWESPEGVGRNKNKHEKLAVCFVCLVSELHKAGIDLSKFAIHHELEE